MVIERSMVRVPVDGREMGCFLAMPRGDGGPWPGVVFFSDIFQLTEPTVRWCVRLAGYGFAVLAPEIYHRREPAGTVLGFDDEGKARGQGDAERTPVGDFDADAAAALAYLGEHSGVASSGGLGAAGHCTGGHLAFRAAFSDNVAATACWYPTGLHDGKLGLEPDAGSLALAGEIDGELLMIFGARDPHTPEPGREAIRSGLEQSGTSFDWQVVDAEHAFGRDIGDRYDPEATDAAFARTVALYRRCLSGSAASTPKRQGIELLWAWLDAVRRHDIAAVTRAMDPSVVWHGVREGLVCNGAAEVAEMFASGYEAQDIDSVELLGGEQHVVLGVRAPDLGEAGGVKIGSELYNVFTLAHGKITRIEDHLERSEALAAAGLTPRAAS